MIKCYRTNPIENVAYRGRDVENVTGSAVLQHQARPHVDHRRSWHQGDQLQDSRHRCDLEDRGSCRQGPQLCRTSSAPGAIAGWTAGTAASSRTRENT